MKYLIASILIFLNLMSSAQDDWQIDMYNESNVNTPFHEFSPIPFKGNFIFVASHQVDKNKDSKNNASYFDLKISATNFDDEMIGSARLPQIINSGLHEGPASFYEKGNVLYFSRSVQKDGKRELDVHNKVKLKIYISEYLESKWQEPYLWQIDQSKANYCHPTIDEKGTTIVYASDRGNEEGKMDLYISSKISGLWTQGQKLDSLINTEGHDCFPYLHPAGYLIFASDGHTNDQGYDLFITKMEGQKVGPAKLLPVPINSNFDDFGMYIDRKGTMGYISSNRSKGKGLDDIYRFKTTKSIFDFLFPKTNPNPKLENTSVITIEPKIEKETPVQSKYNISTEVGSITVFDNIYYDLNSFQIKEGAAQELDELMALMKVHPNLKVQLSAHTDARGSESFNQELSDKRAISARNYLIDHGIDSSRISSLGFGESRIRNHCTDDVLCSESEHQFNRRTEVKILDN